MADKNLEEAKRLNKQAVQGNVTNFSSNAGAQEAQQYNAQSGKSSQMSGTPNMPGGMNADTQQARQLNAQSAGQGGFSSLTGNDYGAQEARRLNAQTSGSPGKNSFSNQTGNSALEQAKKANQQSSQNKKP
jgi:hypothetical protein